MGCIKIATMHIFVAVACSSSYSTNFNNLRARHLHCSNKRAAAHYGSAMSQICNYATPFISLFCNI